MIFENYTRTGTCPSLVRWTCTDSCRKDAIIDRFHLDRQDFQPILKDHSVYLTMFLVNLLYPVIGDCCDGLFVNAAESIRSREPKSTRLAKKCIIGRRSFEITLLRGVSTLCVSPKLPPYLTKVNEEFSPL